MYNEKNQRIIKMAFKVFAVIIILSMTVFAILPAFIGQ
jgi:hypothetical protein